jgi:hypothetical protein
MGWDDIIENKQRHYQHDHRKNNRYSHENEINDNVGYYQSDISQYAVNLLRRISKNRKLKFLLLGLLLLVIALIIFLLVMLIPLIGGLVDIVKQEGLKGITESVAGFIERLWTGAGNR